MKPRSKLFLGLVGFLLVICVQFSDEFSLREKRDAADSTASPVKEVLPDAKSPPSKPAKSKPAATLSSKTISKKTLPVKKSRVPAVAEDNRIVFGKVKISDLKPCISKAFCEVNSITEDPTYEANKEFYLILNRLKKYIDGDEKDINSASAEEDEPSSEESSGSYEHIPHGPPPGRDGFRYPQYPPPPHYPGYRRGKSLKTKNKVKLAEGLEDKSVANGTQTVNSTVTVGNQKKRSARLDVQEKQEKSEFVARKTRELNVVDDLAALIKISAEIGQALRSPRRCRTLFKRCEMSYEEIISIFNRTQKVESSDTVPEKRKTSTTAATTVSPSVATTGEKEDKDAAVPGGDSGEGNRNKKSRDEFSDEEDVEYITDSEVQPVKTYSLFSPSIHHDNRHPEEILVDEAFKKFENTFPASGAPENLEYIKKELRKSPSKSKKSHSYKEDDEDEEESDESASGSRESLPGFRGGATHRSSEWSDPVEKHKYPSTYPEDEDAAGFDDGAGDQGAKKKEPSSSEEEEEEDDEGGSEEEPAAAGTSLHTRDEEDAPDDAREPHSVEDEPEYEEDNRRPGKKDKNRNKKKPLAKPAEESSEEEQEMPPQDSPFYGHLSHLNGGQGVTVVPQKIPKDKKKQKKRRPQKGEEDDYEAPQQDYPGSSGGGGVSPEGNYYPQGSDPSGSANGGGSGGGFFQSIMSWFSGGNKQSSPGGSPSSSQEQQQPQPYGGGSPPSYYGGKPYGGYNKELPTYEDYKPSSSHSKGGRPPSRYPSEESYSRPPYSGDDEEPEYNSKPPSRRRNKSTNKRRPAPQGRVEEDSSEEAEEDDEDETIRRKPSSSSSKKPSKSGSGSKSDSKKPETKTRVAPPPPVIIVPEGEVDPYSPTQATKTAPINKKKKAQKGRPSSDEESREETSSEEAERKSSSQHNSKKRREPLNLPSESNRKSNPPQHGGSSPGGIPSYEKYFNNIFGTVEESQTKMKSSNAEDRENSSLLLSEFDKISSSFATSADKIPDWSEEDNPRKKINVGSLVSNGKTSKGKYTVNKNRNRNRHQYSSGSYEEPPKDAKESSEEEDKKKK